MIMGNVVIVFGAVALAMACNSAARPVVNTNSTATQSNDRTQTAIAHSSENRLGPATNATAKTKWTQSGDPIDTSRFDGTIKEAEKTYKSKPMDESAKKLLGQAYFDRGFALTEARQYASALGDYRRALQYDPDNDEAKNWIDQILVIYETMGKESPKEGEEPPPLPFKKGTK
jgi:tetratricopeptide (TPR) repeat protein